MVNSTFSGSEFPPQATSKMAKTAITKHLNVRFISCLLIVYPALKKGSVVSTQGSTVHELRIWAVSAGWIADGR
jgi:hypothetical protein